MSIKSNLSNLPINLLQNCYTYLDAPSLANATAGNKTLKSASANPVFSTTLVFAKQVDALRRSRDMYALLQCDLPLALTAENNKAKSTNDRFRDAARRIAEQFFKAALQQTSAIYIKSEERTFIIDMTEISITYKGIKLIGRDASDPIEREKHVLLKPLKESNGSTAFKMTAFAAQTLGTVVREDESINALVIQSSQDPTDFLRTHLRFPDHEDQANMANESFHDQAATTLLRALPAGRLRLFGVVGGFGHETMKEYIKLMPSLYDSVPCMDPQDTILVPVSPLADDPQKSDEALDNYITQMQDYFTSKALKNPNSVAGGQGQCVVM